MLVPKLKRTFTIRSILISLSGFAFLISCLVLNIEATSNGFTVFTSRAFATYNENGKDNEQITYVKYSLRTILLMTPKQLKKMVENIFINENEKQIISGFSEKMSRHLIFFLNRDIFSAKKLLREMRRAKTKKQRKKVLKKYSDQFEKESSKFDKEYQKLLKKRNKVKWKEWRRSEKERFQRVRTIQSRIRLNLHFIKNWARDLTEGNKVDKLQ